MNGPLFTHDCDKCRFIGIAVTVNGQADLYQSCLWDGSRVSQSQFILRYGNEGRDYATTDNLANYLAPVKA